MQTEKRELCEEKGRYETCINPHEHYYRGCTDKCKYYNLPERNKKSDSIEQESQPAKYALEGSDEWLRQTNRFKESQPRKTIDEIYEQYIGNGQMGIDFEKKHIIEALKVAAGQRSELVQPRKTARQFIIDDNNTFPDAKRQTWEDLEKQNLAYDLYGVERLLETYATQFQGKELREELIIKIFGIVENTPELNMANYTYEQVSHQNQSIIDIYLLVDEYLKTR